MTDATTDATNEIVPASTPTADDDANQSADTGTGTRKPNDWIRADLFRFPLDDVDAARKLLVSGILAVVAPLTLNIALIPLWGWMLGLMRHTIQQGEPEMPAWADWNQILRDGLWVALVRGFYWFPVILVYIALGFVGILMFFTPLVAFGTSLGGLSDIATLVTVIGPVALSLIFGVISAVSLPLTAVAAFFAQIALVRVVVTGKLKAGFDISGVWKMARFGFKYFILAFLMWAGIGVLAGFITPLLAVTVIGAPAIPFVAAGFGLYQLILGGALYGAAYNEIKPALALAGGLDPNFDMVD